MLTWYIWYIRVSNFIAFKQGLDGIHTLHFRREPQLYHLVTIMIFTIKLDRNVDGSEDIFGKMVGIEPEKFHLQCECSALELLPHPYANGVGTHGMRSMRRSSLNQSHLMLPDTS